jgi:TolA-binding protein
MKLVSRNHQKHVLGVFVDGRDLRLAHLGWEHGEIVIHALESMTLQHRMGKIRTVKSAATLGHDPSDGKDVFGLEDQGTGPEIAYEDEASEGDVSSALINIFSKYPLSKMRLSVNSPEGQTTYYSFEDNFKLKGTKLQKRLREEIGPLAGGVVDSCHLDHFTSPTGELTAVVFEGSIPIIEELLEVKTFLQGGAPYIALVQSNELALVNLARVALDLPESGLSALIYIGADFSRVIILKGENPLSFVQPIHEGYTSPQVCQTIFSKILLEQEEAGLPEIENLILAGEVGMTRAFDFFTKQFPEAKVQSFTPGPLNVNELKPEEIAIFPNFAIPVALAWQVLDRKNHRFISTNLLPPNIKESQKYFKIAWHGVVLLGVVFSCMALLSYQALTQRRDIRVLQTSIRQKQESIESLQPELTVLNQIQGQVSNYRTNLEFLDSLIVDPGKWSRLFAKLTDQFHAVNDIWIEDIKSDSGGFTMIGKALARDRIPKLAAGLDGSQLKRVTRTNSEGEDLTYEFELTAKVPAPQIKESLSDSLYTGDRGITPGGAIPPVTSIEKAVSAPSSDKMVSATTSKMADPAPATTTPVTTASQPDQKSALEAIPELASPPPAPQKVEQIAAATSVPKPEPVSLSAKNETAVKSTSEPVPTTSINKTQADTKPAAPKKLFSESYNQGIRLVRAGDTSGAIKTFQEVIAADPQGPEAAAGHYWIGECHFAAGEYSSALDDFQCSLGYEVNPKHEAAMLMLGLTHFKLKQYDSARKWFNDLLEKFPSGEYASCAGTYLKSLDKIGK